MDLTHGSKEMRAVLGQGRQGRQLVEVDTHGMEPDSQDLKDRFSVSQAEGHRQRPQTAE